MFFWFKKRKNKTQIKYRLNVYQSDQILKISGLFHGGLYKATGLWLVSREQKTKIKISRKDASAEFEFKVRLDNLIKTLKKKGEETYDWYLEIIRPYSDLSSSEHENKEFEVIEVNGQKYCRYLIRCGRFYQTKVYGLDFYVSDDDTLINYITTRGNLSVTINNEVRTPSKIQIDKVKTKKNTMRVEGKLFTRSSKVINGDIVIRGRETNRTLRSSNVTFQYLKKESQKKFGLNRYIYIAEIDFKNITKGQLLEEDIYDVFLRIELNNRYEEIELRVGRPTFSARYFLKDFYMMDEKEAVVFNPYFTFKFSNLSLEVYRYPIESFNYLRRLLRWTWLIRLLNIRKDIWLVGEKVHKAQDTGYAFFKYMRTSHPQKRVYYVIDKNSPERKNVDKFGNVLEFKSKKHIWYSLISKKVISSHHPDYLYPLRTREFKNKVKADKIFLQHGVMGIKNMVANYGRNAFGFDTDLFMVSSEFEKEMIVNDFGYNPKDVFVTGLSRFDTLFKEDVKKKKQILIIPTWRDWITTDESFFESEYYDRYQRLINDRNLYRIAKTYNIEVVFCLHPNMRRFSKFFESNYIKVINQVEANVQMLIKESALMITDYSSVGFDFSFLHKPVIYYQFDRSRFIGRRPSHLDLDNDLPGETCFDHDDVIRLVEYYASQDFIMREKYKERANKFIKYKDSLSSERIYKVINETKVTKKITERPKIEMLKNELYRRYRRGRYYFPSMKLLYKIGSKVIPIDKKLILFESGLGKQYGDSPKNIYDEIVNQDLDYKKVWVYNKQHRFVDPNTKRVIRLSPQYYYYLLRAKYWVNNQNFPTYIKKRNQTVYLQTWHGTPLKKMLYDIEEVHGRSEDYVERVGEAVKNWDYLISPSKFATQAFRSAFRYEGEVLEVGYPRNDIFYKKDTSELMKNIYKKLNIDINKKIILYAPTFRDDQKEKNKFYFDVNMDLYEMKEQLGDEYVVLLRMHVIINNKLTVDDTLSNFVYNVSNYPDIQELLLVTDILITDYSSVMFDFANTGKPILFYTYDLENYRNKLRGFYIDFENRVPGPLVYDTVEIIENIKNIDQIKSSYREKYKEFQDEFCSLEDGGASRRVVDRLFK